MKNKPLGIYLHIPFCIRKCAYCDFCSFPDSDGELMRAYSRELSHRIYAFAEQYGRREADTVYFGGGTPTLLDISCFEQIFSALRDSFLISNDAEITVECNPASIDYKGLLALRSLGANRLSIGLQSAKNEELKALDRIHTFEELCDTYGEARRAGFDNISLDLMYGLPSQRLDDLEYSLSKVIELAPEHISAYGLKIEEGTRFFKLRDKLNLPDEDSFAELYERCCERLCENGYSQYEISNFARAEKYSRHNLKYWRLEEYIGFGVAAHSFFEGERFGNSRDIGAFIRGENICEERKKISESERLSEYVMLRLRLSEGIDIAEYKKLCGRAFFEDYPSVKNYVRGGFMVEREEKIAFSTKGFLVSNAILSEMLSFDE